jgi:HD-GYP domain-containing protein (c-di-GMP phosphodiesterase class II)
LTPDRPDRAALPHTVAVRELETGVRAGHYDARCVQAFLDITAFPYVALPAEARVFA